MSRHHMEERCVWSESVVGDIDRGICFECRRKHPDRPAQLGGSGGTDHTVGGRCYYGAGCQNKCLPIYLVLNLFYFLFLHFYQS